MSVLEPCVPPDSAPGWRNSSFMYWSPALLLGAGHNASVSPAFAEYWIN